MITIIIIDAPAVLSSSSSLSSVAVIRSPSSSMFMLAYLRNKQVGETKTTQ